MRFKVSMSVSRLPQHFLHLALTCQKSLSCRLCTFLNFFIRYRARFFQLIFQLNSSINSHVFSFQIKQFSFLLLPGVEFFIVEFLFISWYCDFITVGSLRRLLISTWSDQCFPLFIFLNFNFSFTKPSVWSLPISAPLNALTSCDVYLHFLFIN